MSKVATSLCVFCVQVFITYTWTDENYYQKLVTKVIAKSNDKTKLLIQLLTVVYLKRVLDKFNYFIIFNNS